MKSAVRVILFVAALLAGSVNLAASVTTFFVVRHADKPAPDADRLSITGIRRAEELRNVLGKGLNAVYSTDTRRTWATAAPSALASGLDVVIYGEPNDPSLEVWTARLKEQHRGEKVLIVGHSNTVPEIVRALTGSEMSFTIGEGDYDNLYVVEVPDTGEPSLQWRRYPLLQALDPVVLEGELDEPLDVSAAATTADGRFLLLGSDEGTEVEVLQRSDSDRYQTLHRITLRDADKELDLEGLARHGDRNTFYAIGSHSWRRRNIMRQEDESNSYKNVRQRFEREPDREKNREFLMRFEIDQAGNLVEDSITEVEILETIEKHGVLQHFVGIPSKENGIDMEGIASDGERLYLGFRGPVFRHGLTPVLVIELKTARRKVKSAELRYVNLGGRGVRDLVRVEGGFLIVAGPVGDTELSYCLYFWDGNDTLPGKRKAGEPPRGTVVYLGTIPSPEGAKAEAIALLEEIPEESYEVLILYDGAQGGNPSRFKVLHPSRLVVD